MPTWEVQCKGNIHDDTKSFELSVIRKDNLFGHQSWGWGGENKIILFCNGLGGNHLNPRTVKKIEFALETAEKLCEALNK